MKRRESDSFLMLFLKLRGGINVYYNISVPLKSGQININQTIPEKGKN